MVVRAGRTAVPSAVVPGIPVPWAVKPAVVPASVVPRTCPAPGVAVVPRIVVVRVVVPRRVAVPSAVVPRVGPPVDRTVERTVPAVPGGGVPRLVCRPGVPAVVVIEIDRCRACAGVEVYPCVLVLRDEEGVHLLSALHEDRRVLGLRHKSVVLVDIVGGHGQLVDRRLGLDV